MASIPGWVYLIVGMLIAGVSRFNPNNDESFFKIFLIVGAVFAFVGVIKIIFSSGKKKDKVTHNPHAMQQMNSQGNQQQNSQQTQQQTQSMHQQNFQQQNNVVICPRCRSNNYSNAKYCQMCGLRLK